VVRRATIDEILYTTSSFKQASIACVSNYNSDI